MIQGLMPHVGVYRDIGGNIRVYIGVICGYWKTKWKLLEFMEILKKINFRSLR